MVKRLVQIYGYGTYEKANMLMTKSFDIYGDNRGTIFSEPSFLKHEASDEIIESMKLTGNPIYVEADVNQKNHSNLTRIDWTTANLDESYADAVDWLQNNVEQDIVKDTLGISYDNDEDFDLPVGLEIPDYDSSELVDKDRPIFSAIANGKIDSGAGIFDKEPEEFEGDGNAMLFSGYKDKPLSPESSVLVAKGYDDIHLMQYDSFDRTVYISDIKDLPDLLQANLKMTYVAQTKSLDDLVVLDNVHTNVETLNDDVKKITKQSEMPRIARDYLFLTNDVKDPQGQELGIADIIDNKARANGETRLAKDRALEQQYEREALLKPIDDSDIEFEF